jgi:hypothetical protein
MLTCVCDAEVSTRQVSQPCLDAAAVHRMPSARLVAGQSRSPPYKLGMPAVDEGIPTGRRTAGGRLQPAACCRAGFAYVHACVWAMHAQDSVRTAASGCCR